MTNDTTPAPIGADALREAAYVLIEACERDWPSTPRHRAAVLKHAAALRAALASAAQPAEAPPGHVLVPEWPTDAMIDAGTVHTTRADEHSPYRARGEAVAVYCDMLAAAPKAAPAAQGDARQPLHPVEAMRLVMDAEREHQFLRGTTNWAVAVARAVERAHGIGTAAARAAKEGNKP